MKIEDGLFILRETVDSESVKLQLKTHSGEIEYTSSAYCVFCKNIIDQQINISPGGMNPDASFAAHKENLKKEEKCNILLIIRDILVGINEKINFSCKIIEVNEVEEYFKLKVLSVKKEKLT